MARSKTQSKARRKARVKVAKPVSARRRPVEVVEPELPPCSVPQYRQLNPLSTIPKNPITFDMRDLAIWSYHMSGMKNEEIAATLGVHRNTVSYRVNKVKDALAPAVDLEGMRKGMLALFPLAYGSVAQNLAACEEQTQNAYLKGMGIYVERFQSDRPPDMSDDQLASRIVSLISSITGPKG